jgi:hypothetical protein
MTQFMLQEWMTSSIQNYDYDFMNVFLRLEEYVR